MGVGGVSEMRRLRTVGPTLGGGQAGPFGALSRWRGWRVARGRPPKPGESFQVLGPLCCAIEPWGHAASLAGGRDVTRAPPSNPVEGVFWALWVPGRPHLQPGLRIAAV